MKTIIRVVKKIIFATAVLYSFNIIMGNLNLLIPLNLYTISVVALLGFPGLFLLTGIMLLL